MQYIMQYFRKKNVSAYHNIESKKFTIIVIIYIKKKTNYGI